MRSFEIWRSSSRIGFAFPECADLSNDMFGVAVETTVLSGPGVEMRVAMSILVRFRVVRTLLWVVPTWGSRARAPRVHWGPLKRAFSASRLETEIGLGVIVVRVRFGRVSCLDTPRMRRASSDKR